MSFLQTNSETSNCVQGVYLKDPRMPNGETEENEVRKLEKPIKRAVMNGFPCGQLELELGTLRNQPTETSKQAEASVDLLVYVSFLSVLLQAH